MEVRCPKCRRTLKTQGRIEFPCRHCGTIIRDPRIVDIPSNLYVSLSEVLKIAKTNGVYNRMEDVLKLEFIEVNKDGDNTGI